MLLAQHSRLQHSRLPSSSSLDWTLSRSTAGKVRWPIVALALALQAVQREPSHHSSLGITV